jgi:hypothetical protein
MQQQAIQGNILPGQSPNRDMTPTGAREEGSPETLFRALGD